MNFGQVEEIASAVLYEGYMLYPYRPSAVKNQQRWTFGALFPAAYCNLHPGSESSWMQTQCLLKKMQTSRVTVRVRFLQIVKRRVERPYQTATGNTGNFEVVDRLEVEGRIYQPWQEAREQTVTVENLDPAPFSSHTMDFAFPAGFSRDELRDSNGNIAGAIVREWAALSGSIHCVAEPCRHTVVRLGVRVDNRTATEANPALHTKSRDEAVVEALVSAHIVLGVDEGEFLSSLDPPAGYRDLAAQCESVGVWPILVGDDATSMLASPIILYDYPQIAPESAGNLFDGTEIDEILSLRILTLTEEEKAEIRQSDVRAREVLERTESIPEEQFLKLHGLLRGLDPLQEGRK